MKTNQEMRARRIALTREAKDRALTEREAGEGLYMTLAGDYPELKGQPDFSLAHEFEDANMPLYEWFLRTLSPRARKGHELGEDATPTLNRLIERYEEVARKEAER